MVEWLYHSDFVTPSAFVITSRSALEWQSVVSSPQQLIQRSMAFVRGSQISEIRWLILTRATDRVKSAEKTRQGAFANLDIRGLCILLYPQVRATIRGRDNVGRIYYDTR